MTNKRIVINKPGGVDQLFLLEEPIPVPAANQVQINVLACGVSFGDILVRKGGSPGATFPLTPGYDLVGEVTSIGSAVGRFRVGDRVAALPVVGGYTTYICLPESELVPVPAHLPPADVVSALLNYTTAFRLLTKAATLTAGKSVLVHGAAGGVGLAVLQVARVLGITAYGTVSMGKQAWVRQEGGIPIDYTKTDFVAEIRRLTGTGVDAVLDPIGGANLSRSYKALNNRGTLVLFGASASVDGTDHPTIGLIKSLIRFVGLKLRLNGKRVATSFITATNRGVGIYDDMARMVRWLDEGKINPIVAKTFPLSEAGRAQAMLEQDRPIGKIVLIP